MAKGRRYQHPSEWNAVRSWWRERLVAGRIYELDCYEEGADYFGPLPWPRWVSLHSLQADCVSSKRVAMNSLEFAYKFRHVAQIDARKQVHQFTVWSVHRLFYDLSAHRPKPMLVSVA